jgi:hypothetical protein
MDNSFSMVAKHVNRIFSEDRIFAASRLAGDAAAKHGKDKVVNATVGSILDDQEKLAVLLRCLLLNLLMLLAARLIWNLYGM